ncbi:unnamed protein product, partial [Prorocentrum cordatum]
MKKRHAKPPQSTTSARLPSWHLLAVLLCAAVVLCWALSEVLLLRVQCAGDPTAALHTDKERELEARLAESIRQLDEERRQRLAAAAAAARAPPPAAEASGASPS